MTQKVATERRMKLRQETTSLGQTATVTAKLRNKRQRTVVWLIYHQSDAEKKVIFVNFP